MGDGFASSASGSSTVVVIEPHYASSMACGGMNVRIRTERGCRILAIK